MNSESKTETKQAALINGFFAMIVSIVSLIGGYFLKDPIDKAVFKPHCQVGGVWKPHNDIMVYCEVTKFEDEKDFTISISGTYTDLSRYSIKGKGRMNKSTGIFEGIITTATDEGGNISSDKLTGKLGLQGCDGLGVVLNFEKGGNNSYAFIRETSNTIATPEDK